MLLQALDVLAQRLVLICQLHVEVLLEVQVTLHVRHFAVPEVELASLLLIVLLHERQTAVNFTLAFLLALQVLLEELDAIHHGLLVRVEGRTQLLSPVSFLLRLLLFILKLAKPIVDFQLLQLLGLESKPVLVLPFELDLLEIFKSLGQVSEV